MGPMALIWWIYHFWARFWPYFNFVDFRAYFGPFSLVNRVQFSNADAGAWNSFLRLGIIFYGKLMHKDTKFCYSSFDISTFGFKAPPYCVVYACYGAIFNIGTFSENNASFKLSSKAKDQPWALIYNHGVIPNIGTFSYNIEHVSQTFFKG